MSNMPAYDPNESRKLADQLLRTAKWVMIFDPCHGAVFGAALGVAAGRSNLLLVGLWAVAGALAGSYFSFQRARTYRAQAQALLCQVRI